MIRVGHVFAAKKQQKWLQFQQVAHEYGIDWKPVDWDSEEWNLDLVVHKATDWMALAHWSPLGDGLEEKTVPPIHLWAESPSFTVDQGRQRLQRLRDAESRGIPVVDSLAVLAPLLDRLECMRRLQATFDPAMEGGIRLPRLHSTSILVDSEGCVDLSLVDFYPGQSLVMKPIQACATTLAHHLIFIPVPPSLRNSSRTIQLKKEKISLFASQRMLVQEWMPHAGYCVKVYVLHQEWHVVVRPSLAPGTTEDILYVDSQTLPKKFKKEDEDKEWGKGVVRETRVPTDQQIRNLILWIQNTFPGLHLYGVDLILDERDQNWYLIDVNYFPSYEGMPDFPLRFIAFLKSMHEQRQH